MYTNFILVSSMFETITYIACFIDVSQDNPLFLQLVCFKPLALLYEWLVRLFPWNGRGVGSYFNSGPSSGSGRNRGWGSGYRNPRNPRPEGPGPHHRPPFKWKWDEFSRSDRQKRHESVPIDKCVMHNYGKDCPCIFVIHDWKELRGGYHMAKSYKWWFKISLASPTSALREVGVTFDEDAGKHICKVIEHIQTFGESPKRQFRFENINNRFVWWEIARARKTIRDTIPNVAPRTVHDLYTSNTIVVNERLLKVLFEQVTTQDWANIDLSR